MKVLYYCNPFLDISCRKTHCYINDGPCNMTYKRECALTDKDGEPLKAPDIYNAYGDTPPIDS